MLRLVNSPGAYGVEWVRLRSKECPTRTRDIKNGCSWTVQEPKKLKGAALEVKG
jgi:hypothetical protein